MKFAHENVTAANAFAGSDGVAWDDLTITLNPRALAKATAINNSIGIPVSGGNCLVWPYAALAYG